VKAGGKIAFAGEKGAFAESALFRFFGEEAESLGLHAFTDVFAAVEGGEARYGVIPLENSLAGSVRENYDSFLAFPGVIIAGEVKLRVVHHLLVLPGASLEGILTVRSHPQALAQCAAFLEGHPQWRREPWSNTAAAASSLRREAGEGGLAVAAIASERAARLNGLVTLQAGIETNPANFTRFVVIARKDDEAIRDGAALLNNSDNDRGGRGWKATVLFSLPDEPGSLYFCLKVLYEGGVNLSKIESRPIHGQPWHYFFYLDLWVPSGRDGFETALGELRKAAGEFHFLGAYPAAE